MRITSVKATSTYLVTRLEDCESEKRAVPLYRAIFTVVRSPCLRIYLKRHIEG